MADPQWLTIARKELGTKEVPGPRSSPGVVKYYMGAAKSDAVAWCSAFVGWCMRQAGEASTGSLMAKSWLRYGKRVAAQPGAIAVFNRGKPGSAFGHVTFVETVDGDRLVCIGGNQGDAVTRRVYSKSKALSFRWPA
jgi:uncharacterized protein (TIGR02594 family)